MRRNLSSTDGTPAQVPKKRWLTCCCKSTTTRRHFCVLEQCDSATRAVIRLSILCSQQDKFITELELIVRRIKKFVLHINEGWYSEAEMKSELKWSQSGAYVGRFVLGVFFAIVPSRPIPPIPEHRPSARPKAPKSKSQPTPTPYPKPYIQALYKPYIYKPYKPYKP